MGLPLKALYRSIASWRGLVRKGGTASVDMIGFPGTGVSPDLRVTDTDKDERTGSSVRFDYTQTNKQTKNLLEEAIKWHEASARS